MTAARRSLAAVLVIGGTAGALGAPRLSGWTILALAALAAGIALISREAS